MIMHVRLSRYKHSINSNQILTNHTLIIFYLIKSLYAKKKFVLRSVSVSQTFCAVSQNIPLIDGDTINYISITIMSNVLYSYELDKPLLGKFTINCVNIEGVKSWYVNAPLVHFAFHTVWKIK